MSELEILALVFGLIFAMNVVPAFMPPTWLVLVAAHVQWDVNILVLTAGGAISATAGRTVLALACSFPTGRMLPQSLRANLSAFGSFIHQREKMSALVIFLLTLAPLPSNQLFIASGLARLHLRPIAAGFLLSRLVTYSFALVTSLHSAVAFSDLFANRRADPVNLTFAIGGVVIGVIVSLLPWRKILGSNGDPATPA